MEEEASSSRPASDQDRRVRFEDASDEPEDSSTTGHNNDDPPDESSGSESGDEKRGAHTQSSAICPTSPPKQATVQETADCSPNVSFELQANSTVRIGGNMYSHVQVSNDARLHLGDSITINNFHPDSRKTKMKSMVARIEVTEECLTTLLAAFALLKEMLQTATGLLVLLQVTMSAYRLAKQIKDELVTFEDALGRFQRIDLLFIRDWPAFKQRLQSDFHGTSGSRWILEMRYRLSDRAKGNYLVDPRFPPPFTSVFKQGRHVQMSIHFEWNEVSDNECPRCDLEQVCKADAETICIRCGFSYRGQVESARGEELGVEGTTMPEDTGSSEWPPTTGLKSGRDAPSSFSRITISKLSAFTGPTRAEGPKEKPWVCLSPDRPLSGSGRPSVDFSLQPHVLGADLKESHLSGSTTHRSDKEYIDPNMAVTFDEVQRQRRVDSAKAGFTDQVTYLDPHSNPASTSYNFESSGSWIVGHSRGRSPVLSRRRRSSPYGRTGTSVTSLSLSSEPR